VCGSLLRRRLLPWQAHPVDEALALEYDELEAYHKQAAALNMTKADFVHQMATQDEMVDEKRAERMWVSFQSQLESGAVVFHPNGTMKFSMPITHHIAPYLPDLVSDTMERCYFGVRRVYLRLPRQYRRRLEFRLEALVESGAIYALLVVLLTVLLVDFGMEAVRARRQSSQATRDE
jgi:hypothetical protein